MLWIREDGGRSHVQNGITLFDFAQWAKIKTKVRFREAALFASIDKINVFGIFFSNGVKD